LRVAGKRNAFGRDAFELEPTVANVHLLFELSVGLPQRAFVLVTLTWLFVLAWTIVKVAPSD
jgi:hypothetical protein